MEPGLTVGQFVKFEGKKNEIVKIYQPIGTYPIYVIQRGNERKQAFRYQLEDNFIDSDDDDILGTINLNDLFDGDRPNDRAEVSRFVRVTNNQVDRIQASKDEVNTNHSTKWGVKVFTDWLTFRGYPCNFAHLVPGDFNEKLRVFYAEARTKGGKPYGKSALVGIRAALNRHIQAPPFLSTVNIMKDREFTSSNHVLVGVLKTQKREGRDITTHKEAISPADLRKLFDSGILSVKNPLSLVRKVWFDIMFHFGRRGREGLRNLTAESFIFLTDDIGAEYVKMAYNESNKTNHGIDSRERDNQGRMYASNDERCPVASLRLYLEKRSQANSVFFQRPLNIRSPDGQQCWYYNQAMGVKSLNSMMADISKDAELSQRYTNHCLRATCATVLNDAGVDVKGIMAVTGHRNEGSVRSYVQRPSVEQRRTLSNALHSAIVPSTSLAIVDETTTDTTASISQTTTSHSYTAVTMQKYPQGFLSNANISGGTFNFHFHS